MPEPSLCGTTRANGIPTPKASLRFFVSPGFTPDSATRTRTSPGPGSGVAISPTSSTSAAGPCRSYHAASNGAPRLRTFRCGSTGPAAIDANRRKPSIGGEIGNDGDGQLATVSETDGDFLHASVLDLRDRRRFETPLGCQPFALCV